MRIGLIYGGKGAEELSNHQAILEIERVFNHYKIDYSNIYLNEKKLNLTCLKNIQIFFVIDSNCENFSVRQMVFDYIKKSFTPIICQNQ